MPCVDLSEAAEMARRPGQDSHDQLQALSLATQALVQVINNDLVAVGGTLELLTAWVDLPENLRERAAAASARLVNMADHVQQLQAIAREAADSQRGHSGDRAEA
jgi:hypothetical protein